MKLIEKLAHDYSANHDEGWTCTDCCADAGFMAGFRAARDGLISKIINEDLDLVCKHDADICRMYGESEQEHTCGAV